jgi:CRP-like cAMP-binding protein
MTTKAGLQQILSPRANALLAMLDADDYASLMTKAKIVKLKFRAKLCREEQEVEAVHFPLSGVVSLLVGGGGELRTELATVGREGVVGATEILQEQKSMALNLIQVPGFAVRVARAEFLAEIANRPGLSKIVQRYQFALLKQILYAAACNRRHSLEERCSRWLLMTHDRASEDTFPLTQDFLAHMLGVRRASVNVAMSVLKKAGLNYVRGRVSVVDRVGLQSTSCDCYQSMLKAYAAAMNIRDSETSAAESSTSLSHQRLVQTVAT